MDWDSRSKEIFEQTYEKPARLNASTITLGCEFEFLLIELRDGRSGHDQFRGPKVILELLSEPQYMLCADPQCQKEFLFHLPITLATESGYDKWQVGLDDSVRPSRDDLQCLGEHREDFHFYPIEIQSRVLRYYENAERASQSGKHEHWISFQDEIQFVLGMLDLEFGLSHKASVEPRYHVLPSSRSGLHCHVGNGVGVPICFETAKRLFSVFVACERQFDQLVGTRDITGTTLVTEPMDDPLQGLTNISKHLIKRAYNKPLSVYLIIATHMRRQWNKSLQGPSRTDVQEENSGTLEESYFRTVAELIKSVDDANYGYDIDSWLKLIGNAGDVLDLRSLYCLMDKHCTINLQNIPNRRPLPDADLPMDPRDQKLTFEFRQHAGTMVAADVFSFIELAVKLMLTFHNIDAAGFKMLMKSGGKLRRPSLGALDLLEFIGCNSETIKFYDSQISGKNSQVTEKLDLQEANIKKYENRILIAKFALSEINKLRNSIDSQTVKHLISKKVLTGGYGQFSSDDLKILLPNKTPAEQREHLTIGYQVPVKVNAAPGR